MTILVVGARPGSLGAQVKDEIIDLGYDVVTAGINGEDEQMNVLLPTDVRRVLETIVPESIVFTVGINLPDSDDPFGTKQMEVNFHGAMRVLRGWLRQSPDGHFAAVSSNSAHVARSGSAGYCASKAALSMGIRCVARETARSRGQYAPSIYAWEFGLLEGTPMTQATRSRLGEGLPLTRMVGLPNGIPVRTAARRISAVLAHPEAPDLNGCTLRVDAGEQ